MAVLDETVFSIADQVWSLMDDPHEVAPFTNRYPGYRLEDAYRVVELLRSRREARGERVVGRKIGFTNTAVWDGFGITGPIWNYLYDTTTRDISSCSAWSLGGWPNVRMETEIALGLCSNPHPDMSDNELLNCVDWIALDFEVCTSIFPRWDFEVADAATTGVHVALLLGERHSITHNRDDWADRLQTFTAVLTEDGGASGTGGGALVLGSPVAALGYLVREMARYGATPLGVGDIVTTGTLTPALPAKPNQVWRARVDGIPLAEIRVELL